MHNHMLCTFSHVFGKFTFHFINIHKHVVLSSHIKFTCRTASEQSRKQVTLCTHIVTNKTIKSKLSSSFSEVCISFCAFKHNKTSKMKRNYWWKQISGVGKERKLVKISRPGDGRCKLVVTCLLWQLAVCVRWSLPIFLVHDLCSCGNRYNLPIVHFLKIIKVFTWATTCCIN